MRGSTRRRAGVLLAAGIAGLGLQLVAARGVTSPVVYSLSPSAAPAGATVTIKGGPFFGARLPATSDPRSLAVGPGGQALYVSTSSGSGLAVIDLNRANPSFHQTLTTIPTPSAAGTTVSPAAYLYLSDIPDQSITVVDVEPSRSTYNTVVGKFSVPMSPAGMAFTADGARAYVGSFDGSGRVAELTFDGAPLPTAVTAIDGFGYDAHAVTLTSDGQRAYVISTGSNRVSMLDTDPASATYRTIVSVVTIGGGPRHMALAEGEKTLIVTSRDSGVVSFLDVDPSSATFGTVVAHEYVGAGLQGVVVSPDGLRAFVSVRDENRVQVISLDPSSSQYRGYVDSVPTGAKPINIAASPDGATGYVANSGTGDISILKLVGPPEYTKRVEFGTTVSTAFRIIDDSTIEAVVPELLAGAVHVTVTTSNGVSPTTAADLFTVTGRGTTVSLSTDPPTPTVKMQITLLAHVTAEAGTPTQAVTFWDGGSQLGSAQLDSASNASIVTDLPGGLRHLTARYSGDFAHDPSTGALDVDVALLPSSISVSPPPGPTVFGRPAPFQLTSDPAWLGSFTIRVDGAPIDTAAFSQPTFHSYVTTKLVPGDHLIEFSFAGDDSYSATSVTVSHHVDKAPTSLEVAPVLPDHRLLATLRDAGSGSPIAGQVVSFVASGRPVCHATTDESGDASCTDVTAVGAALISGGYEARFPETNLYLPSSGHASIV